MMDIKRYEDKVAEIMKDTTPLPVVIDIQQAWLLIAGLQLAYKHPGIGQALANHLEHVGRQFQQAIVEVRPDADELIEMGWNSEYDQRPARYRKSNRSIQ